MIATRKHVTMLGNSTWQGSAGDLYELRADFLTWQEKRRCVWGGAETLSLITMTHNHRNGMYYLPTSPLVRPAGEKELSLGNSFH